jgi:hypothetical protein
MRRLRVLLVTLLSLAGLLSATGPAAAATPPGGYFYLKFFHSGKCVSVPGDALTSGLYLTQWTCLGKSSQQFYFDMRGGTLDPPRTWGLVGRKYTLLCVAVKNGWTSNGVAIVQQPCETGDGEMFEFKRDSSMPAGYYWMTSTRSGKVVNVSGASTANGAGLIQYPAQHVSNSYVTFVPA